MKSIKIEKDHKTHKMKMKIVRMKWRAWVWVKPMKMKMRNTQMVKMRESSQGVEKGEEAVSNMKVYVK